MKAAGIHLAFDLTQHSVIGVTDVLKKILKFRRLFNQLLALAIERKPDVVIGVDYGGFNLRMAAWAKAQGIRVFYYISPKIWAWNQSRVEKIKRQFVPEVALPYEAVLLQLHACLIPNRQ